MIKIFKDGDHFCIETDSDTRVEFLTDLSWALDEFCEKHKEDLQFQFEYLLPFIYQISLSLDGYKTTAHKKKVTWTGNMTPTSTPEIVFTHSDLTTSISSLNKIELTNEQKEMRKKFREAKIEERTTKKIKDMIKNAK